MQSHRKRENISFTAYTRWQTYSNRFWMPIFWYTLTGFAICSEQYLHFASPYLEQLLLLLLLVHSIFYLKSHICQAGGLTSIFQGVLPFNHTFYLIVCSPSLKNMPGNLLCIVNQLRFTWLHPLCLLSWPDKKEFCKCVCVCVFFCMCISMCCSVIVLSVPH